MSNWSIRSWNASAFNTSRRLYQRYRHRAWLGTIMLFNVGANLANQQKVLGLNKYASSPASPDEINQAKNSSFSV